MFKVLRDAPDRSGVEYCIILLFVSLPTVLSPNGKAIDAVRVYYNTPADYASKYGYQKAQYRVSPLNGNYWPWQYDNETGGGQDGYAGAFGYALDKFQLF